MYSIRINLRKVKKCLDVTVQDQKEKAQKREKVLETAETKAQDLLPEHLLEAEGVDKMPRPRKFRRLRFDPEVHYFKPQGIPLSSLEEVILLPEESEALKLYEIDCLEQKVAAEQMEVSQPTFARILDKAHKKLADAVISGKAIKLEKRM